MIESKTARKRKAKVEAAATPPANGTAEAKTNGTVEDESSSDSHYMKELTK